jgi:hypothetical protein
VTLITPFPRRHHVMNLFHHMVTSRLVSVVWAI